MEIIVRGSPLFPGVLATQKGASRGFCIFKTPFCGSEVPASTFFFRCKPRKMDCRTAWLGCPPLYSRSFCTKVHCFTRGLCISNPPFFFLSLFPLPSPQIPPFQIVANTQHNTTQHNLPKRVLPYSYISQEHTNDTPHPCRSACLDCSDCPQHPLGVNFRTLPAISHTPFLGLPQ